MSKKSEFYNHVNIFFVIFLLFLGVTTSVYKGYGDDTDSHALIIAFINMVENGHYSPSRSYGSPFGELFYGFFGYFFGSFISSFLSYIFFLSSIVIFYKTFVKKKFQLDDLFLFILICFSNPVLFLDNTNPSDAPLSLFLFSLGTYFFYRQYNIYAAILFGLTIATRANYALLVFALIFYEIVSKKKNYNEIIKIFIYTCLIGSLFYLPILIKYKFSLSFISNAGGPNIELKALLPRFIYKTYVAFGIFSFPVIIYFYILNKNKFNNIIFKNKILLIWIFLNLLTYFFIPTKTSIISLVIICVYILIFIAINRRLIFVILIFFNFIFYLFSYQIFDFKYKYKNACDPIEAIDARLDLKFTKGYFFLRTDKLKNKIVCDSKFFRERSFKYLNGEKIK